MAQTFTLSKFLFRNHTLKLFLLLLFCFAGVQQSFGQTTNIATLPTGHEGPWPTGKAGWTFSGIAERGANLGTSTSGGSALFNVNSSIEVYFDDVASQVSFDIKENPTRTSSGSTFNIYEKSSSEAEYSLAGQKVNPTSSTSGEKVSYNLKPETRWVKLVLVSTNNPQITVQVDDIRINKGVPKINVKQGANEILSTTGVYAFGRFPVGSQSTSVVFTIENLGTADLKLTSSPFIKVSGPDFSDFIVDISETDDVIAPGGNTTFSIIFKPLDAGAKSAIITIDNNDAEINPYTFNLTGLGVHCPEVTGLDVYQGIVGSWVYVYGSNFEKAIGVTFGGVEAGFTVLDDNTIDVQVPEGAQSGPVVVYSADCSAESEAFTVLKPTIYISETEMSLSASVGSSDQKLYKVSAEYLNGGEGVILDVNSLSGDFAIARSVDGPFVKTITIIDNIVEHEVDGVIVNRTLAPVDIWVKFTPTESGNSSTTVTNNTEGGDSKVLLVNGEAITLICPEVTGLDIYEGKVGDWVYIYGSNFEKAIGVTFGGVEAGFTVLDDNTIDVQVPEGAQSGPVVVYSADCSAESEAFTVLKPTIIISQNTMSLSTNAGTSEIGFYFVEAYDLLDGASVTVDVSGLPGDYTISRTGEEGTFVKTITFESGIDIFDNAMTEELYVRFSPTTSGESSVQITHSSEGANTEILTVNGSAITPLPVELIAFNARMQNGGVLLTWATASEQDNDYFEVQMTDNLKGEFKTVGKVNSRVGTTSLRQDYKFDHKGSFLGTRYYRLKQVDFDGTTDYSKVVEVKAGQLDLAAEPRVYPNPIKPNSKLEFSAAEAGKLNVSIVNMSGTRIQSKSYDVDAGVNTIELNLSDNLPTGIYILMTEFNGKTQQVKLLKQ